jgi:hypothetical protein
LMELTCVGLCLVLLSTGGNAEECVWEGLAEFAIQS